MKFKNTLKGHVIKSKMREIVANILQFMTKEKYAGKPLISLVDIKALVAPVTGFPKEVFPE